VKEPPLAILKAIQYELAQDSDGARQGFGIADEAVLGLMGFLIAFTFSGAASRVDTRRHLVARKRMLSVLRPCGLTYCRQARNRRCGRV
jgi:hypothetical protein